MNPVYVALDTTDLDYALQLAQRVRPHVGGLKLGLEFFTAHGAEGVRAFTGMGLPVFLDLKFHDIPNTVAGACAAAARLGVAMMNIHASGGRAMMTAAREAIERSDNHPLLIAVTVLTSLADSDMRDLGIEATAPAQALRLARLAKECGLDGVVCSAQEAPALRTGCGPEFKLVTPGIRPADAAKDDQARIVTPMAAIRNGADYLVIGRPITHAADPVATLAAINASLE